MDKISLSQLHKELKDSIKLDPYVIIKDISSHMNYMSEKFEYFEVILNNVCTFMIYMPRYGNDLCSSRLCMNYKDKNMYGDICPFFRNDFMIYRSVDDLINKINDVMNILYPLTQT